LTQMTENLLFLARAENANNRCPWPSSESAGIWRRPPDGSRLLASGKGVAIEFLATRSHRGSEPIPADPGEPLGQRPARTRLPAGTSPWRPAQARGGDPSLRGGHRNWNSATAPRIRCSTVSPGWIRRGVRGDGSGLGLSLVKAAMDLHQGQVKIEKRYRQRYQGHFAVPGTKLEASSAWPAERGAIFPDRLGH